MRPNKKLFLFCMILFSVAKVNAQQYQEKSIGVNVGIVLALGNHFDRIGININAFFTAIFFQTNADLRIYYNLKNLGPKKHYFEAVASLGMVFAYGKTYNDTNLFISLVSNQTKYKNSFSYAYNCYFNKIKTTQQTGIFGIQIQNFTVLTENDIFARPRLDRFRSGAMLLQYQNKNFQFAINSTIWTGQMGNRNYGATDYYPNGYMDTVGAVYPECSHGMLSLQVKTILSYSQTAQLNLGADAEQIRNSIQNKLLHNQLKIQNAPIPMLDENGNQFMFREGQKIRQANFYYNVFLNPNIFY